MSDARRLLRVEGLGAAYGPRRVLEGIDLAAEPGRTLCVIGPSGCGKTTLLTVLAGLRPAAAGTVRLDGSPVPAGDPRVGLILQHFGLFPWMTAAGNVEVGLKLRRVGRHERRRIARLELERVGLADEAGRWPGQLSGGQQQRVAIARTMALQPTLLLMDEPFSALDELTREGLQDLLAERLAERPVAAVLVTHSVEEAVRLGTSVLVLAPAGPRGPGPSRIAARVELPWGRDRPGRADRAFFEACAEVRLALRRAVVPAAGPAGEGGA